MADLANPTTGQVNGVPVTKMSEVSTKDVGPPMQTGNRVLDDFFSTKDGVPRGTINIWGGEPGAGKTTLACEAAANIEGDGNDVLFVSSEMDHMDFQEYVKRFPHWGNLTTYFPDLTERDVLDDMKNLVQNGFDLILVDSFLDVKDKIAEQRGMTKKNAEMRLVDLFKKAKKGEFEKRDGETVFTTWIAIQQMTKGGDLAGSKYLQHVVTSDLRLIAENEKEEVRYMMFNKNRRGNAYDKLYYEIDGDTIDFDVERREREEEALDFLEEEKQRKEKDDYASIDELEEDMSNENGEAESEDGNTDDNSSDSDLYDLEKIEEVLDENDGSLRPALEDALERGIWNGIEGEGVDDSYHYWRSFLTKYGLDDYNNAPDSYLN